MLVERNENAYFNRQANADGKNLTRYLSSEKQMREERKGAREEENIFKYLNIWIVRHSISLNRVIL